MHAWVVGRGGLLGSAVSRALGVRDLRLHREHVARPITWADPELAVSQLHAEIDLFRAATGPGEEWAVLWCAGVGVVGTSEAALAREEAVLAAFVERLALGHPAGPGAFVLSSSAGVYAGSAEPPFDEATTAVPLNAYGRTKLRQEQHVAAVLHGRVPVAVARISTLYGPGQNILKPQGLITQVCLRAALRQPLVLYVSKDTMRDYLFVADAGHRMVEIAAATVARQDAQPRLRVVASAGAVSIAEVIGLAKAASRHPVGVVYISRATSSQHVRDLRVRSRHAAESAVALTSLRRGVQLVHDDIVARARRGELVGTPAAALA